MPFSGLTLTADGQALYAKAQQGKPLHFTRVSIGDGVLGTGSRFYRPTIISEKKSLLIDAIQIVNDVNSSIVVTLQNDDITEGFSFREIMVMAEDPDTHVERSYLYDNAGTECEPIPPYSSGVIVNERLKLLTVIENVASVSFIPSGNPLYLSIEDIGETVLAPDGDASEVTAVFVQATTRTNLTTGEKLIISLGKIMKWFADLGTAAFTDSAAYDSSGAAAAAQSAAISAAASDATTKANAAQSAAIAAIPGFGTSAQNVGTSAAGSAATVSRADHVHALPDVTTTANTSTASPADGDTVTMIDSITTDGKGRVTAKNIKTVTLPTILTKVLTGLSTASNAVITATDTVLSAFGKLQAQISLTASALTTHAGNTSNPHGTTYAQANAVRNYVFFAQAADLLTDIKAQTNSTVFFCWPDAPNNPDATWGCGLITCPFGDSNNNGVLYIGQTGHMYTGKFVSGTFTGWRRVYDDANKPTPADLGAAAQSLVNNFIMTSGKANQINNLNTVLSSGLYCFEPNTTGAPFTDWGFALCAGFPGDNNWATQLAMPMTGGGLFFRRFASGSWQPWYKIYNETQKPTPADIGAATAASGTYTGNGNYGSGNPNTLNFTATPKLVVIMSPNSGHIIPMLYGNTAFRVAAGGKITASWTSTAVSWYAIMGTDSWDVSSSNPAASAFAQFNENGVVYKYMYIY